MSLILEALRKLERERETSGRGFLVVAHTPWRAARGHAARLALVAMAAGALAGGAAWTVWSALSSRAPAAQAPAAGAVGTPVAPALPPPIWETSPAAARTSPTSVPRFMPASPVTAPAPAGAPRSAPAAAPEEPPLLVIAPSQAPAPAATAAPLRLEAISSQDGEPVAVINGRLVRKGDTVDGAVVTWIGPDAVEVEVAGRRRVLGF